MTRVLDGVESGQMTQISTKQLRLFKLSCIKRGRRVRRGFGMYTAERSQPCLSVRGEASLEFYRRCVRGLPESPVPKEPPSVKSRMSPSTRSSGAT